MRRRVPRQSAEWPGKYRLAEDPEAEWAACRLIDVSVLGVGVELFDLPPEDLIGHRLAVEVETPAGASVRIGLVGVVRNSAPGSQGGVRVGMEFTDLSETERSILDVMEMMQVVW